VNNRKTLTPALFALEFFCPLLMEGPVRMAAVWRRQRGKGKQIVLILKKVLKNFTFWKMNVSLLQKTMTP